MTHYKKNLKLNIKLKKKSQRYNNKEFISFNWLLKKIEKIDGRRGALD